MHVARGWGDEVVGGRVSRVKKSELRGILISTRDLPEASHSGNALCALLNTLYLFQSMCT